MGAVLPWDKKALREKKVDEANRRAGATRRKAMERKDSDGQRGGGWPSKLKQKK